MGHGGGTGRPDPITITAQCLAPGGPELVRAPPDLPPPEDCVARRADADLDAAEQHWSTVTGVPRSQFRRAYRAAADPSRRSAKHEMGCATVISSCSRTACTILALCDALLASPEPFRGGAIGSAADC